MDRKSIAILVVCFILLMSWPAMVNRIYPPKPLPPGITNVTTITRTVTNPTSFLSSAPTSAPSASQAQAPAALLNVNTNVPVQLLVISNDNARYTFTSSGGGLEQVELLKYPEVVANRLEQKSSTNRITLDAFPAAPTLALLDGEAVQGDGIFKLTRTANGVRAEKTLPSGLTIVKEFQPTTNYLMTVTIRLENHSAQPLALPAQEWVVGTAAPLGPRDSAVGVLWYNGAKASDISPSIFSTNSFLGMFPHTPPAEFRAGASNVVWAAAHNQFFALAVIPQQPAQAIVVRNVYLPFPTGEKARLWATNAPAPSGLASALVYPALTLAQNQSLERQLVIFAGPKEYQTLALIGDRFNNNLDLIMGFNGFFGFFSKMLLLGMNAIHNFLTLPYGWAIIAITVIIKVVFWPLTQASTRSMKRMQTLQPQMQAIKEKYKDDPVKMNRKTMEFMKEHKVSPLGGCLPMALQMPVFIGFFYMIRSAIELRGAHFLWVKDLAQPDTLFVIPGLDFVPFIGIRGVGLPFNLLPLLMGTTMLWQARLTPTSPGMDQTQAKMMRYLPLIFMVSLYNFSAGLTLYWTVQNLLTIAQTKLTKTIQETPGKGPVLTPQPKKRK